MKCNQCRFYDPLSKPWEWRGSCNIKLPPGAIMDANGGYIPDRFTRGDSGCDLGQPIEEKEETADDA